jgi:hypothetical protein
MSLSSSSGKYGAVFLVDLIARSAKLRIMKMRPAKKLKMKVAIWADSGLLNMKLVK